MKWLYIVIWIWFEMAGSSQQSSTLYYQEFESKKAAIDYLYVGRRRIGGDFNVYRRGSNHAKDIRKFEITSQGVEIMARFEGQEGIMIGSPRRMAEAFDEAFGPAQ